jgi:EAL domain-containing protein (putative c-di-GMP-specific phosphodiesterase class I)
MAGPNPLKDPAAGAVPGQGEASDATLSRTRIVSRPSLRAAPSATTRSDREAASILLVDDDPAVLRAVGRSLRSRGYAVVTAQNGEEATRQIGENTFDVILSDIGMPGINGIQLLRQVREHDLNVPIILITGEPAVETAVQALEYGAFHYLTKPIGNDALEAVLEKAVRTHRMARIKQQAAELLGNANALGADRAGLEASFERAMQNIWMAYQPIVDPRTSTVYGHEALLRSNEPTLPHPGAVLDAATRLGRLEELGRLIRNRVAEPMKSAPLAGKLFVNLHVTDLLDPQLSSPNSPLAAISTRVVLEITERSSLDEVRDVRARVAVLREMGYSIAVDDLGAGYAGLTSFTLLEPEIVKLDMSLIRDAHQNSTKQKVVRSMTALAKDMGMIVVAEGVESIAERDVLVDLGCDYLQGYLFARPGPPFPEVKW